MSPSEVPHFHRFFPKKTQGEYVGQRNYLQLNLKVTASTRGFQKLERASCLHHGRQFSFLFLLSYCQQLLFSRHFYCLNVPPKPQPLLRLSWIKAERRREESPFVKQH